MRTKNEAFTFVLKYVAWIERESGNKVKIRHCDRVPKLVARPIREWADTQGIKNRTNAPYSSEQNSVEKTHGHIANMARAMLQQARLPKVFFGYAVLYASKISNRLPHPIIKDKPHSQVTNPILVG